MRLLLAMLLTIHGRASAFDGATKIAMGDPAPYNGVVVSYEQFMFIDSELAGCKYLKRNPPPCEDNPDLMGMVTVGLFSFSLGALAVFFVQGQR